MLYVNYLYSLSIIMLDKSIFSFPARYYLLNLDIYSQNYVAKSTILSNSYYLLMVPIQPTTNILWYTTH